MPITVIKDTKERLVREMVENGYFIAETIEQFAARFTLEDLIVFHDKFLDYKKRGN